MVAYAENSEFRQNPVDWPSASLELILNTKRLSDCFLPGTREYLEKYLEDLNKIGDLAPERWKENDPWENYDPLLDETPLEEEGFVHPDLDDELF